VKPIVLHGFIFVLKLGVEFGELRGLQCKLPSTTNLQIVNYEADKLVVFHFCSPLFSDFNLGTRIYANGVGARRRHHRWAHYLQIVYRYGQPRR
jgi:hypothetical protein